MPVTSSPSRGTKRKRNSSSERNIGETTSNSAYSGVIEITNGITKRAASYYLETSGSVCSTSDIDTLISLPILRNVVRSFLLLPTSTVVDGPVQLGVVRLVANSETTLVFTSDSLEPLSVSPEVGRSVCIGDVLLLQRVRVLSGSDKKGGDSHQMGSRVQFVAFDPSSLQDADDWCHAASWNAVATAKWVRELLSHPPGLAQVTCIIRSVMGGLETGTISGANVGSTEWLRTLQLPLLLRQLKNLTGVSAQTALHLKKVIFSVARLYVTILSSAEAVAPLPHILSEVVCQFLASPLFVQGFTQVLHEVAGAVSQSTWAVAQQSVKEGVWLGLRYVSDEHAYVPREGEIGWNALRGRLRADAECGVYTVLHHLTSTWLRDIGVGDERSKSTQHVTQLVEELAHAGLFRRFVNWVRHRERMVDPMGGVSAALRPPTMQEVRELRGLQIGTVKEMMAIMASTYTPYLRPEALRFIECSARAAYAELYGPAARAVNRFLNGSRLGNRTKNDDSWELLVTVVEFEQPAIRSSLASYSFDEVQLHSLFGVPLVVTLRTGNQGRAFTQLTEVASSFGYVLVRLSGSEFIFPVITCNVCIRSKSNCADGEDRWAFCTVDAYILRDGDMLPSLLKVSTAVSDSDTEMEGVSAGAWFFFSDGHSNAEKKSDDGYTHTRQEPSHFFPEGTPAISYMLYFRHLQSLCVRLTQEGREDVCAPGHLERLRGKNGAWQEPLLWCGNKEGSGASGNIAGQTRTYSVGDSGDTVEKMFAHSSTFPPDGAQLRRCLDELVGVAMLTPPQVECIYALAASGCGIRALVGAVGSGKTVVMHAVSLARGRVNEDLRKEQTPLWHSLIKQSGRTLSDHVAKLEAVESMDDLFYEADKTSGRDLLEELTSEAASNINEHVQLSEKLRCCHAPLLLRPRASKHSPPKHTERVLNESTVRERFHSLDDILQHSCDRSMRAPLAVTLNAWLRTLQRLGSLFTVVQETTDAAGDGEWKLFTESLSWIMNQKERQDTLTEAKRRGKSWVDFLAADLWDSSTVTAAASVLEAYEGTEVRHKSGWRTMGPLTTEVFRAVNLPNAARSLCEYSKSEASGWRAVYGEKQVELLNYLQKGITDEVQCIFSFFLDLVYAVAAMSQVSKVTVLTATRVSLLREISFIRTWLPRYLVIDDYDQVEDAVYLALSPASVVVVSQQMDAPLQSEQRVALAVLRSAQKELQGTPFCSTAVLTEAIRFASPELYKGVSLCRSNLPVSYATRRGGATTIRLSEKDSSSGHVASEGGAHQSQPIPGLSSSSCIEIWTHAVPLNVCVKCDGVGAAFACSRIRRADATREIIVFCCSSLDRDIIVEGMSFYSRAEQGSKETAVCILPFVSDVYTEQDEECDIAVLCLSGLVRSMGYVGGLERQRVWEQMLNETTFVEVVERWLWKAVSRARHGVLLIGSKELFRFLEPLQRLEGFSQWQRDKGEYWLPAEAGFSALALRCPEHVGSRQLAILTHADYCGCQVRVVGVQECRSLCLASYSNCTNTAHACLHVCHAASVLSSCCSCGDKSNLSLLHDKCPFPCAREQRCGHPCLRSCSEPCSPCEFVGLKRLPCGQSVVTGVSDNGPTMAVVHHFQQVRCGEEPLPCEESVTVRCRRCKGKLTMRCCDLAARGGFDNFSIRELECEGCVTLYNRVAKEYGTQEVNVVQNGMSGGDLSLPVHHLPAEAQEKFRKLLTIAMKKGQLLIQKEALETMQGREASEFHRLQGVFNKQLNQQKAELQKHRERAQENIQLWEKKLKQQFEAQVVTNEEVDAKVPFMLSEATAEEQRQQQHDFV